MTLKHAVVGTGLALALTALCAAQNGLVARTPVPKTPTRLLRLTPTATGRLIIKFNDDVVARAGQRGGLVQSLAGKNTEDANAILAQFGLKAQRAISVPDERLQELQRRAASFSGKAQPDLAGMMYVIGPRKNLEAAARALNELTTIEWVQFEEQPQLDQGLPPIGTQPLGACCVPSTLQCVDNVTQAQCLAIDPNAVWQGAGSLCADVDCGYTGACCVPNQGACVEDVTQTECLALDPTATFVGAGTVCADVTCVFMGACCVAAGSTCVDDVTESQCLGLGGTYMGDSTNCDDNDVDCGFPGACCLDGDCLDDQTKTACIGAGGVFKGYASTCEDPNIDCTVGCGLPDMGSCFVDGGNGSPFCDDDTCCQLICTYDPFCCAEDDPEIGVWDGWCAMEANYLCDPHNPPDGADHCHSPLNGGCFEPHVTGGCAGEVCCNTVCMIDPGCCTNEWDAGCVILAQQNCIIDSPFGQTPDFEDVQGYLTPGPYNPIPDGLIPYVPVTEFGPLLGFGGEGWNLRSPGEPFTDVNGNGWWDAGESFDDVNGNCAWDPGEEFIDEDGDGIFDPSEPFDDIGQDGIAGTLDAGEGDCVWQKPGGLWGVGEELLRRFDHDEFGQGNLTLGRTTRVGVIEWAYYENHEDLNVTTEPGQTLIMIPEMTEPDHGTATSSIIGALDNGMGVTGIVPEADMYFFPLTSVEEGPRELAAWTNALLTFGPGDVLSASYGPPTNLNNAQSTWTMLRLGSDLGITSCIAAGNNCINLDTATDLGDSGAIVVGACSPGWPWYRLAFSNYYVDNPDAARSNIVHVRAWGTLVGSAAYGNLYLPGGAPGEPGDIDRSYTPTFGGTSAAAPQIAGLVAGLQGLAKQFYGIALLPETIRSVMGAPGRPPLPPVRLFGGFPEGDPCGLDLDPTQGPNFIGVYPDAAGNFSSAASVLMNQTVAGFDDAPLVDEVIVLRGIHRHGNKFSIKGDDQNYLVIESQFTPRNLRPEIDFGGGIGFVGPPPTYLATGDITDIAVLGHADIPVVNSMQITTETLYPGVLTLFFVEAFDFQMNRWSFINFETIDTPFVDPDDPDWEFDHVPGNPNRFVRPSDRKIFMRIWTLGFGSGIGGGLGGDGARGYELHHDLVNLQVDQEFGVFDP